MSLGSVVVAVVVVVECCLLLETQSVCSVSVCGTIQAKKCDLLKRKVPSKEKKNISNSEPLVVEIVKQNVIFGS